MADPSIPYILVVEDNSEYARGLQIFLQQEGFKTSWAEDVAKARRAIERQKPGLILLDISLPDENGIEFCRRLKNNRLTANVPVILLSAHLEMATFLAESDQGADKYLDKSITYDKLLKHINKLLKKRP